MRVMNAGCLTSLETQHYRVVDRDGNHLYVSPGAKENARRWFRYPEGQQVEENTSDRARSKLRQLVRDGISGPFTVEVYAQHKPTCPCKWHRLSGWVEPLEPGLTSVFRTDKVEFCCGRTCAPDEVDSVQCEWDKGDSTSHPRSPFCPDI